MHAYIAKMQRAANRFLQTNRSTTRSGYRSHTGASRSSALHASTSTPSLHHPDSAIPSTVTTTRQLRPSQSQHSSPPMTAAGSHSLVLPNNSSSSLPSATHSNGMSATAIAAQKLVERASGRQKEMKVKRAIAWGANNAKNDRHQDESRLDHVSSGTHE